MAGDQLVTPHAVISRGELSAFEASWGCLDPDGLGAEGGDNTADRRCGERNRSGTAPCAWTETYSDRPTSIDYSSTDRL